ncbi:MAG: hypothetical protein ACRD00_01680 [Thermoanaerobaculia bacterium]
MSPNREAAVPDATRGAGSMQSRIAAYTLVLWLLAFLFFLRVLGQVLVAFFGVTFLPPMAEWYSGLLPYPVLLPTQVLILILLAKICSDFSRGHGFFVAQRPAMGHALRWFSYLYFAAMLLRYVVTMAVHPEQRWLGGTIPIVFHWVLAAYIFTVGHFYTLRGP